jgi:hypothetical protein
VVLTPWKNISQWEGLSHILWKIKHVWNQQPDQVPGGTSVFMPLQLRHKTTITPASVNSSSQPFRIFRMIPHVIVNQQVDVSKIWMIRLYGPSQIFTSQKSDFWHVITCYNLIYGLITLRAHKAMVSLDAFLRSFHRVRSHRFPWDGRPCDPETPWVMKEILHQLIDGLSRKDPIIYSVPWHPQ